jgi:hypothetical protein
MGDLINTFFLPSNEDKVAIPDFLKVRGVAQITFRKWYAKVSQE